MLVKENNLPAGRRLTVPNHIREYLVPTSTLKECRASAFNDFHQFQFIWIYSRMDSLISFYKPIFYIERALDLAYRESPPIWKADEERTFGRKTKEERKKKRSNKGLKEVTPLS